jgi:hypothetical protein
MSQTQKILEHMEAGNTVTPLSAQRLCGTLALHSRISDIRAMGYTVTMEMRSANGSRWGEYWLAIPH